MIKHQKLGVELLREGLDEGLLIQIGTRRSLKENPSTHRRQIACILRIYAKSERKEENKTRKKGEKKRGRQEEKEERGK